MELTNIDQLVILSKLHFNYKLYKFLPTCGRSCLTFNSVVLEQFMVLNVSEVHYVAVSFKMQLPLLEMIIVGIFFFFFFMSLGYGAN